MVQGLYLVSPQPVKSCLVTTSYPSLVHPQIPHCNDICFIKILKQKSPIEQQHPVCKRIPAKTREVRWPCAFTALKQLYPALLNSVVSSSTCKIIRIKSSPSSSTFLHPWKTGTQQWSSLAKLPSSGPKFRMGQFWNSWLLHLRLWVFLWTVETDEINIKWWIIMGTIMGKTLPGLPGVVLHYYTERLSKSNHNSCLRKSPQTTSIFYEKFDRATG